MVNPGSVCAWCHPGEDFGRVSHGICGKCSSRLKAAEIVEFSLLMAGCQPFVESMSRNGAAAILRAIRGNENYIAHGVR